MPQKTQKSSCKLVSKEPGAVHILLFDTLVIDEAGVRIPDPDIRERAFLAAGLCELDPDLSLPDTGEGVAALSCLAEAAGLVCAENFTSRLRQSVMGSTRQGPCC